MTTTQIPTEFASTSVAAGLKGTGFVLGHASVTCPRNVDDPEAGPITDEMPWPCSSCIHVDRRLGLVAMSDASHFADNGQGGGSASVAAERDPQADEAIEYAKGYSGSFEFMLAMKEKAERASWVPTPNMVRAILACKAREVAPAADGTPVAADAPSPKQTDFLRSLLAEREGVEAAEAIRSMLNDAREIGTLNRSLVSAAITALLKIGKATTATSTASAPADLPEVDEGYYAVDTEDGHLAFYQVDRPTEGKWAGRTFLSVLASDERHPIRGAAAKSILAKIAEDPNGPECRKHLGM